MFSFFRKKEKTPQVEQHKETELSEDQKKQLGEKIQELQSFIAEMVAEKPDSSDDLAGLYERLGLAYAELGDNDKAMTVLEKSLSYKLSITDGYKKLMSIYNSKRAEAARNGDDEGIEKYMNKMDDMRQIAKKVTITG